MFERILVPLDGSPASEAALAPARTLARAFGSTLILAHIVERRAPKTVHGEPHLAEASAAAAYLQGLAAGLAAQGLPAETHVHIDEGESRGTAQGAVAATLADHAAELGFDLAVMAAHGRRSAGDFLAASLPLKVAAAGCSSVYLSRSPAGLAGVRAILLPLDGKPEHEAALGQAEALARALGLPLELYGVVPRRPSETLGREGALARFSPALNRASLEYAAEGMTAYLSALAGRLGSAGLAVSWRVDRGRPGKAILKRAKALGAVVVLSTHRKLGMEAALDGCVAFTVATAYGGEALIAPVPRCRD